LLDEQSGWDAGPTSAKREEDGSMANFGEDDRFRSQMFEGTNKLRFERPVDDASRRWWLEKFYDTFGLTPEDMADRISRSAPGDKSAVYHFIDGSREAFSLRVSGDFPGTQEFWFAHRDLDLKGAAFNAESITIPDEMQGSGYGRELMADLVDTGRLIGIDRIKLRAEQIGRYAWVKMGFRPTDDAWREMKKEAYALMVEHMSELRQKLDVTELMTRIEAGGPKMALTLATLDVEILSGQIQDRSGRKPMPFGKVFFLEVASPWSGVLDLRDAEVMKIVESYRKKK
jgi:GNAT superfamily N-acetyltransferase